MLGVNRTGFSVPSPHLKKIIITANLWICFSILIRDTYQSDSKKLNLHRPITHLHQLTVRKR